MSTMKIPTPLRPYTNGLSEIPVHGRNVAEALGNLVTLYPTLKPHLYNNADELRPYVNLFINDENIRDLQGIDTPIQEYDRLMLIPSIAGGWI
jgi:molybdopterin converting factor small subunit